MARCEDAISAENRGWMAKLDSEEKAGGAGHGARAAVRCAAAANGTLITEPRASMRLSPTRDEPKRNKDRPHIGACNESGEKRTHGYLQPRTFASRVPCPRSCQTSRTLAMRGRKHCANALEARARGACLDFRSIDRGTAYPNAVGDGLYTVS